MGKGLALLGLILIIVGFLPIIFTLIGFFTEFIDYFFILGLYELTLGTFVFSELMLILIGLGVILLIVGAMR